MTSKTMLSAVAAGTLLFGATAPEAGAAGPRRIRHSYGLVGFAAGQSLRLNVVNAYPPGPTVDGLPPGPIRIRLSLLDADGRVLRAARAGLLPGQSTALELDFASVGGDVRRAQVRAQVEVILPPGPTLPPGPSRDAALSSLEVIDVETARTSLFVHPAVIRGFNPQPDPPRPE